MFDEQLLEHIKVNVDIRERLESILEEKTWEQIALALYQILDDIDTADDMCKENSEAFRNMVMKLQAKKNQYLYSPDGYVVVRVDEGKFWKVYYKDYSTVPPTEVEMKKWFEVETEQEALAQAEGLLNKEAPGGELEVTRAEAYSPYTELAPRQKQRLMRRESEQGEKYYRELDKISQEMFGEDFEELPDYDHQQAVKDAYKLKKARGITYTAKDVFPQESVKENLTAHAKKELELAGMFDKEVDGSEAAGSWNNLCADAVVELITAFAKQGHSGFSASMTRELFNKLSNFEVLTELTDDPDEWMDRSEFNANPTWQSCRHPACFSEDGGKTYWNIDEIDNSKEETNWNHRKMHTSKPMVNVEKKE